MSAGEVWTVRRLLEWTGGFFARKQLDSPRLSAELLLAHVLKVPRIRLYTDYERPLGEQDLTEFRALVQRAAEHEPIAYLTGRAHFFNLEFEVTPDVLIPRPDTETLVENVLQLARHESGFEQARVLDLCTGSGCIAAAVAHHLKHCTVVAVDLGAAAIEVAQRNIERLGLAERVRLLVGDLFEPLKPAGETEPFSLILSNPPYIPTGQLPQLDRNVREYEPLRALDGGADGLDFHRRILRCAPQRLRPGGRLYIEIAFDQAPAVLELARQIGHFSEARILKDYAGHDRVLAARKAQE